jgi:hypothetical protein
MVPYRLNHSLEQNLSFRRTAEASGEFCVRGTPSARREQSELSLRSSACSSGRRRWPFEQSLEPRPVSRLRMTFENEEILTWH